MHDFAILNYSVPANTLALSLQWLGCVTAAFGSLLLALQTKRSGYGWIAFLISNLFWIAYGLLTGAPGLVTQQIIFTCTSMVGIWRWLIKPGKVVHI